MRKYQNINDAWNDFYNNDSQRSRNALLLHYAPIAKYVAYRMTIDNQPVRNLMAESMLAIARAIDQRPTHTYDDWTSEVVAVVRAACRQAILTHGIRKAPE